MVKILLIDDEEFTRKELGGYLEEEGYYVITASEGEEGIRMFEEHYPELVLTDVKMPKIDGFEVLRWIKSQKPETRVIILTGHGDEDMVMKALKEGANDYIKKPLNLNHLSECIMRAIESIRSLKRTTFNASSIITINQLLRINNNLDEIYGVTNYITNLNHIYFTKASCEKIKLALIETLRNSIEHGNLEIGYDEKSSFLEEGTFNNIIKDRMKSEKFKDRKVSIEYKLDEEKAVYIVEDDGNGSDWKNIPTTEEPNNIFKRNGRGILLIRLMMDDVLYNEKGNIITLIKYSDIPSEEIRSKNIWISHYIQNKHDLR